MKTNNIDFIRINYQTLQANVYLSNKTYIPLPEEKVFIIHPDNDPRDEVRWFARKMEETLKENDYKGGWQQCSYEFLIQRLIEELRELELTDNNNHDEVIRECTDVANFAMMIADKSRRNNCKDNW